VCRAAGLDAVIHPLPSATAIERWLDSLASQHDVLVAAGGDGTVSTVAAATVRSATTLGVIPTGTLNHFARDAGIPSDLEQAVDVIAAGHTRRLDVADVNGSIFINNASIGAYPRMVWERNREEQKGRHRVVALILAVVRTWLGLRSVTVRLSVDGVELIRRTPFVVIGNGEYQVEGVELGKRVSLTDATLALYVAPESGRLDVLTLPVRAFLRRLHEHEKFETLRASSLAMDLSRRRISVALDGEIRVLEPPLRFSVKRAALRAIAPAPRDA